MAGQIDRYDPRAVIIFGIPEPAVLVVLVAACLPEPTPPRPCRRPRALPLDDAPDRPDPGADAAEVLERRERASRVREAVARLPERQRRAIALTYDADLSNADGAAAMDTSVGAFELLLVRARRALRQTLAERPEDGSP